jgi:hypothetical protein
MTEHSAPRPYDQWRTKPVDRAEDAAYVFGYDLMRYCRAEALKSADPATLPKNAEELQNQIAAAVDVALHNVADLLEGFFPMNAGPNHKVSYALSVCVANASGTTMERIDISPSLLDLPIGYWDWKDGEFRAGP